MDTSLLISLAALVVSILALPTSYFVAVRQVKIGLDESERRSKQKARFLVADRLDEFFRIFITAVKIFIGIERCEIDARLAEINPYMQKIDEFVRTTGILDRLAKAIDDLAETGYADLSQSSDLVGRVQSIRGQIALGSDDSRNATARIIEAWIGADTSELRGAII